MTADIVEKVREALSAVDFYLSSKCDNPSALLSYHEKYGEYPDETIRGVARDYIAALEANQPTDASLVIIESPYAGDIERNTHYARRAMRDSLDRGENPIASHLIYTQPHILDEFKPEERKRGIEAGFAWWCKAGKIVFYTDYGYSNGMNAALEKAKNQGKPYEIRQIGENELAAIAQPADAPLAKGPDAYGRYDDTFEAKQPTDGVHLSHCNQGEYEGSCKYGDKDCPACKPTNTDRTEVEDE